MINIADAAGIMHGKIQRLGLGDDIGSLGTVNIQGEEVQKLDEVATEVRRFVRTQIDELLDSREPQVLAGIISDFRVINGQRGKLGLFKLDVEWSWTLLEYR